MVNMLQSALGLRSSKRTVGRLGLATLAILVTSVFAALSPLGPTGLSSSPPAAAVPPTSAWTTQSNYGSYFSLQDMSCPTSSMCVAVGVAEGTQVNVGGATTTGGAIEVTLDGGSTWHAQSEPSGVGDLIKVSCANSSICVALSSFDLAVSTTDGGVTWSKDVLPNVINDISCPSPSDCVGVGQSAIVSNDGGSTWQAATIPSADTDLRSVSCASSSDCVAIGVDSGESTVISTSTDGGRTWTNAMLPTGFLPQAFSGDVACSPSTCVATSGGAVEWSNDGGLTWQTSTIPSSISSVSSLACGASSVCVGSVSSSSGPQIIYTSNGGQSWTPGNLPSGTLPIPAVTCVTDALCRAIASVTTSAGSFVASLLTTADGGATWTSGAISEGIAPFTSISCSTAAHCDTVATTPNVLTTANGGSTWTAVSPPSGVTGLQSISCSATSSCLLSAVNGNAAKLFATSNGGTSWQSRVLPSLQYGIDAVACAPTLDCAAGATSIAGYPGMPQIVGNNVFSTDGGVTWKAIDGPFDPGALACSTNSNCIARGDLRAINGIGFGVQYIAQGGNISEATVPGGGANPNSSLGITCVKTGVCEVVGESSNTVGAWYQSTNYGSTWTALTLPSGVGPLSGVSCFSATTCTAVGQHTDGTPLILSTTDGGSTWAEPTVPSEVSTLVAVSCPTSGVCEATGTGSLGGGVIIGTVVAPPTTSVVLPATGATVSGSATLDATASSGAGVASVSFEVSGGSLTNHVVGTAAPTYYGWVSSWDTTTVPNGTYTLESVATDVDGTTTTSAPVTITVSNLPRPRS